MRLMIKLAFRNLFRNTRRTSLTVLLIGFSLTALILTDALVLGMLNLMFNSATKNLVGEAQIHTQGFRENYDVGLYLTNATQLSETLTQNPEVKYHAERIISSSLISSSYNLTNGIFYGINANAEAHLSNLKNAMIKGNYLTHQADEILIGQSMADLLEVDLGDRIVVTLSEVDRGDLAQALFRVSGIFEFGLREIDDNFVFVNIQSARDALVMTPEQTHEIAIVFNNPDIAKNPAHAFFQHFNIGKTEALGWIDLNPSIASVIEMSGYSSLIIGVILFLLASLGVINSLFMSIYERIYEFGVAKAIGTKPRDLVLLILTEAFLIAIVSCIFGMLVGYLLGSYGETYGVPLGEFEFSGIAIEGKIRLQLASAQFIDFPIYVVTLTLVVALYPARFAARIVPTEALQRSL